MPAPKKGVAFTFDLSLISQSTGQVQISPTLAAGDVTISGADGTSDLAAFGNITVLPTETPASSGAVKVQVSASEMNFDRVVIKFKDAAGAEWNDLTVSIYTTTQTVDDLATQTSVDTIDGIVDAILVDTGTTLQADITAIKAKTDSLTFTTAGQVDANVQYVNNVEVTGTGASGDEWGPV